MQHDTSKHMVLGLAASIMRIFNYTSDLSSLFRWDCSFRQGSLVEEVDGHTAVLYHRLQLHWGTR